MTADANRNKSFFDYSRVDNPHPKRRSKTKKGSLSFIPKLKSSEDRIVYALMDQGVLTYHSLLLTTGLLPDELDSELNKLIDEKKISIQKDKKKSDDLTGQFFVLEK
ncbi:MAG: hypothetical protein GXP14_02015 [Gammaproteobacteria bacterium]|nr:hypothetical protein [Gammaproteobacteria bacterium]